MAVQPGVVLACPSTDTFYFAPSALGKPGRPGTWGDAPGFHISRLWRLDPKASHSLESEVLMNLAEFQTEPVPVTIGAFLQEREDARMSLSMLVALCINDLSF